MGHPGTAKARGQRSVALADLGGALGAQPVDLHLVLGVDEAVLGGNPGRPLLRGSGVDLDGAPTAVADEVVVVGRRAVPEGQLAAGSAPGVDLAVLRQRLEHPIDRGQAGAVSSGAQIGMELLLSLIHILYSLARVAEHRFDVAQLEGLVRSVVEKHLAAQSPQPRVAWSPASGFVPADVSTTADPATRFGLARYDLDVLQAMAAAAQSRGCLLYTSRCV